MTLITCKKCGIQFGRSTQNCIRCGTRVEYSHEEKLQLDQAKKVDVETRNNKKLYLLILLFLIGFFFFGPSMIVIGLVPVLLSLALSKFL